MFYCLIVLSSAAPKAEETKLQISPTKQQQESETSARLLEDELPTAPQNEAGKSTIQQPEETEDTPIAAQQNEDENSPVSDQQSKITKRHSFLNNYCCPCSIDRQKAVKIASQ